MSSLENYEIKYFYRNDLSSLLTREDKFNFSEAANLYFIFVLTFCLAAGTLTNFLGYRLISDAILLFILSTAGVSSLVGTIKKLSEFSFTVDTIMVLLAILMISTDELFGGTLLIGLFFIAESIQEEIKKFVISKVVVNRFNINEYVGVMQADRSFKDVRCEDLLIGDRIKIEPGDIFPCKCKALMSGVVSLASVNGESKQVKVSKGSYIISGAKNIGDSIIANVSSTFENSLTQSIMQNVLNAEEKSSEKFSWYSFILKYYSLFIVIVFFMFLAYRIYINRSFLTIFQDVELLHKYAGILTLLSPCSIVIPIPIAIACTAISLYRKGISLKDMNQIYLGDKIKSVFFDKTGTLTKDGSEIKVIDVINDSCVNLLNYAQIVFEAEKDNRHPIGIALTKWSSNIINKSKCDKEKNKYKLTEMSFRENALMGFANGLPIRIGATTVKKKYDANVMIEVTVNNDSIFLVLSSPLRDSAKLAINNLKKSGIFVYMITGDSMGPAYAVADYYGISRDRVMYNISAINKAKIIERSSNEGIVLMVGDGINDALALKSADIGLSVFNMNLDLATIISSNGIINGDNMDSISALIKQSKKLKQVSIQNISIAISVMIFGVILVLKNKITLPVAVFMHEGSTLLLSLNALRMLFV